MTDGDVSALPRWLHFSLVIMWLIYTLSSHLAMAASTEFTELALDGPRLRVEVYPRNLTQYQIIISNYCKDNVNHNCNVNIFINIRAEPCYGRANLYVNHQIPAAPSLTSYDYLSKNGTETGYVQEANNVAVKNGVIFIALYNPDLVMSAVYELFAINISVKNAAESAFVFPTQLKFNYTGSFDNLLLAFDAVTTNPLNTKVAASLKSGLKPITTPLQYRVYSLDAPSIFPVTKDPTKVMWTKCGVELNAVAVSEWVVPPLKFYISLNLNNVYLQVLVRESITDQYGIYSTQQITYVPVVPNSVTSDNRYIITIAVVCSVFALILVAILVLIAYVVRKADRRERLMKSLRRMPGEEEPLEPTTCERIKACLPCFDVKIDERSLEERKRLQNTSTDATGAGVAEAEMQEWFDEEEEEKDIELQERDRDD